MTQAERKKLMKIGSITHEELCKAIADAAHRYGWHVAGFRTVRVQRKDGTVYFETPVKEDGRGFPDLLLLNDEKKRSLVIEVKVKNDKLKPEQRAWLEMFDRCGIPAYEIREQDWIDGTVLKVLC